MKRKLIMGAEKLFRAVRDHLIREYGTYGMWEMLLGISSASFVLFGILARILGDSAHFKLFTGSDLWGILGSVGIGCVIYCTIAHLSKRNRLFKVLTAILLIVVFLLNSLTLLAFTLAKALFGNLYESTYEDAMVHSMIRRCRLFGPGVSTADEEWEEGGLSSATLLPRVAYTYGYWILVLYTIIYLIWLCAAVRMYLKIYARWHEWLFLMSFLMFSFPVVTSLLGFIGVLPCTENVPFTASLGAMYIYFAPSLSTICAVVKLNNDAL